jgi:hypothetical protein
MEAVEPKSFKFIFFYPNLFPHLSKHTQRSYLSHHPLKGANQNMFCAMRQNFEFCAKECTVTFWVYEPSQPLPLLSGWEYQWTDNELISNNRENPSMCFRGGRRKKTDSS